MAACISIPTRPLAHARHLVANGADIIELGAASSHPDASKVDASEEITRLVPVLDALAAEGIELSVDTTKPEVQRFSIEKGIGMLNDIRGFPNPELHKDLASATADWS